MEPRPSRPSRATGPSSTRSTRTPWTPSPTVEQPAAPPRTADIYSGPQGQGGQWYGQPGTYAPDPDYRQTGPMTPIKPRGERGNKLLRYLLAALLLIGVIGGGAYAITRFLDDDDTPENPPVAAVTDGTVTPTQAATQASEGDAPAPTATTAAETAPTEAPPAAAEATEAPADESVDAAAADTEPTAPASQSEDIAASESAEAFLPDPVVLTGDWAVTNEGERTKAEVADAVGPDGDALLTSWRWRENFYRDFNRNDAADAPEDASFINVSVHRFANAEGASEALTALADIVVAVQGLQDVETPVIGDAARGLAGAGESVNLYVLYVQDGKYLIRIGGSSAAGDPAPTVNALAEEIVANTGEQTA